MKKLRFTKMHGISNDYVYISTFDQPEEDWEQLAIRLSDRRTGIGGDGIILVCPSEVAEDQDAGAHRPGRQGAIRPRRYGSGDPESRRYPREI